MLVERVPEPAGRAKAAASDQVDKAVGIKRIKAQTLTAAAIRGNFERFVSRVVNRL